MRILAISDRPPRKPISQLIAETPVQAIVTLGDLDFGDIRELASITNIPKFGVYGNHCSGTYMEALGIQNLHLRSVELGGVTFGGFQGSVRYKPNPQAVMYTQEEASELLKDFPRVDVMLAHSPPRGINDEDDPAHLGLEALRTYLEEKRPAYFLHGHTYPNEQTVVRKFGDTEIVYVYQDNIVDLHLPRI